MSDRLRDARAKRTAQPQNYELSAVGNQAPAFGAQAGGALAPFFSEISAIQSLISTLNDAVHDVDNVNRRLLGPLNPTEAANAAAKLEQSTENVRRLLNEVKSRIKQLSAGDLSRFSVQDRKVMKDQTGRVRQKFVEALQTYQSVEQTFQARSKQRVERGYKILNPQATPAEVQEFVQGHRQMQTMAGSGADYASTRATLSEVQQRHVELQKMERTLADLAQLFNDMAFMIQEQDQIFDNIENTAADVESDAAKGVKYTDQAVESARKARRKRWILFAFVVTIIAILAIALAIKFGIPPANNSNAGN